MKCGQCGGRLQARPPDILRALQLHGDLRMPEVRTGGVRPAPLPLPPGPSCRCPICGTYRVVRLKAARQDRPQAWRVSQPGGAHGRQGPLFHCRWCRLQFFDRRPLATEVPTVQTVQPAGRTACRKRRRLPGPLNSVLFQVESAGRRPTPRQLAARTSAGFQPLPHSGLDQERPCAGQRRGRRVLPTRCAAGETIDVEPAEPPPLNATAEDIPLTVLYEDADLVAIDKPAGMVVHAGAGVHSGTLVNALLHRFAELSGVGGALRPGIVHRLDRFTSGVLLVAKNDAAHRKLAEQFAGREVEKDLPGAGAGRGEGGDRADRAADRARPGASHAHDGAPGRRAARRGASIACCGGSRVSRCWKSASGPAERTRSASTWRASSTRSSATRCTERQRSRTLGRYFLHAHRIEFQQPTTGEANRRGVPPCAGVGSVAAEVIAGRITFAGIRPPRFPPASISPGGFLPAYHLDDSAWLCSGWCGD